MGITLENKTIEQIRASAPLMMAYFECSDELQKSARKMFAALNDPALDDDDRNLTLMTLADILFPQTHESVLGSDLKECEEQGASHSDETRTTLGEMDQEEASFSNRLRSIMTAAGVTQAALADRIEVGQPAISMMLNRECRPQKRTVVKLAKALSVQPEDLWPNINER
jgi:DNA-binding XRE family transcriptional regulator